MRTAYLLALSSFNPRIALHKSNRSSPKRYRPLSLRSRPFIVFSSSPVVS